MIRIKKLLAVTVALLLVVVVFTAAGRSDTSSPPLSGSAAILNTASAFPIVTHPITLEVMVGLSPVQPPFGEIHAMREYEKLSGITITWNNVPATDMAEKRSLAFASNTLPDIFMKTNIPATDIYRFGDDGALRNLTPMLNQYAPNFMKLMDTLPQVRQGTPGPDGSIYALPVVFDCIPVNAGVKLFLNGSWIQRLGLRLPTTTDELYNLLVAFKGFDANGNGQADEIPLASDGIANVMRVLNGAFGISNMGAANGNFDTDPATGRVRFFRTTDEYRQMLMYMNRLYSEGLLAREVFTYRFTDLVGIADTHRLGGFPAVNVSSRANVTERDYVALNEALTGPNGHKIWGDVRAQTGQKGAFAITHVNRYPEASLRWVDYFYSEEGAVMVYLGIEGVSFYVTPAGDFEFLPELRNNIPQGSSFDSVIARFAPYVGGGMPVLTNARVFKGGEMDPVPAAGSYALVPYFPRVVWPAFSFSISESENMARYATDINRFVDQATAEFVQGTRSFNTWADYVAQIERMGLRDYTAIFQGVVNRVMR